MSFTLFLLAPNQKGVWIIFILELFKEYFFSSSALTIIGWAKCNKIIQITEPISIFFIFLYLIYKIQNNYSIKNKI